ncbi:MAG: hypothetical protein JXJ04_13200, partial [Spirochaetales bacterium]|nr:hypothetical protein [Spirochaetales bacterium]
DVRDILTRALKVDNTVGDIHYQLARYFKSMNEPREEEKALLKAKESYAALPPLALTKEKLMRYIDSYNRLGTLYYQNNRTGHAETELDNAISLIEDRQKKKILHYHEDLGQVYYNRGNIFYDYKDFPAALDYYEKAGINLYNNPEMNFKMGYIHYRQDNYLTALLEFYKAEGGIKNNPNILFSIGNALYYRGDYFTAQGYYNHLLDILEKRRAKIEYVRPDDNPSHKSLFNIIMRTYNNLGVTLKKLSEVSGDQQKEAEALVYLTKSSEVYDTLDRLVTNPETMERDKITKNLAFLNQRHIFYPRVQYELSLYKEIPLDTKTLDIDDLFSTKVGN